MHEIEPYFNWRDLYVASEDARSPFYGREYSEFEFTNRLYNYFLHPQWDQFGSSTLYLKVLFVDYEEGYAIMELIGEWNDTLHNDVMFLKRNLIEPMMEEGVVRFVFFCDNLLNYHASEDDYYAEWFEETAEESGWVVFFNTRHQVRQELEQARLDNYIVFGDEYNEINWRPLRPQGVYYLADSLVSQRSHKLQGW